jgi:hypothetical protein
MRNPLLFLSLPAALALASFAGLALTRVQDPVETPPAAQQKPGIASFTEDKRARIEQALEGVWMLVRYDPADLLFDARNMQGVAMFHEGYLSLNVMAQTFQREFLGDGVQLYIQGGAHRYRVNEFLRLQTAAIIAFHNFDDDEDIEVEASGSPREYEIELDEEGKTLTLTKSDGAVLTWSKLGETEFPAESADALDRVRGRIR